MNKFEQPNYYAIIPADVRYDKRLSMLERLLYGEITALSQKTGYCWASNAYFANLYDRSIKVVSNCISNLAKYDYIDIAVDKEQGNTRIISINENVNTYYQKRYDPINENVKTPINENVKRNNTSINNTSINNTSIIIQEKEEYPLTPLTSIKPSSPNHTQRDSTPEVSKEKYLSQDTHISKPSSSEKKDNNRFQDLFDRFYSVYPKKKGKEQAKKAFMKLRPDDGLLLQIIKAIERQSASNDWLKNNGDFIPYPATWLNGKRWEDELDNSTPTKSAAESDDWYAMEEKRMQAEYEESERKFIASGLDRETYMAKLKEKAKEKLRQDKLHDNNRA